MTKDNVKLALLIAGIWGSLIIAFIGIEAVVHDGAIASVIVDGFLKVMGVLVLAVAGIIGVSKIGDTQVQKIAANNGMLPVAPPAAPSEPTSSAAGLLPAAPPDGGGI